MNVNDLLAGLAPIGLDPGSGGYRRFSWTSADHDMRRWFTDRARERDLVIRKDRNANLWAFKGDPASVGIVAVGSHLDSVPDGGPFDGPLGIASAFAALDLIELEGLRPRRTVAVVAFAEEEGARFGSPCLGSRLLTGALDADRARALTDPDGVTLAEAMTEAGEDPSRLGADPSLLGRLDSYVELHIEQGLGLQYLGAPLAIGSGIWPHGRWRLDFTGTANHAGTTPMEDRNDPMARFAATALRILEAARARGSRATFGRLEVVPNSTNAIPSRVSAWLDARAETEEAIQDLVGNIGPDATAASESMTPGVEFDATMQDRLTAVLGTIPVLATAAGHDAGVLASARVPSAMLFVRNPTGVSHSPLEHAAPEDCIVGAESLARVLADLGEFQ